MHYFIQHNTDIYGTFSDHRMNEDVRDILDVERAAVTAPATKESLMAPDTKKSSRRGEAMKRPQGMHREVFALLYSDSARG